MNPKIIAASITFLLTCSALSCKYVMPERYVDYNKGRVPVNLPRGLKYSEADRDVDKPNAAVITVTADGRRYLGTDHSPIEGRELGPRIQALLAQQSETDKVVYLAADAGADYGHIVSACDEIRMTEAGRIGLLVTRLRDDWPRRLTVEVLRPPDPNEDVTNLRPNPLTLLVAISPDLSLTLNTDAIGSVNDLDALSRKLRDIFRQREESYALKPGYETRTDLPMSERVEATTTIRAPKRMKYGDVVKVIDAARGAGARPIILQLDDLPD
jgi:biopolymer transport protein ExbD